MRRIVRNIFYGMIFILAILINSSFSNATTANNPVIVSGLTPVKYTGSTYTATNQTDTSWYDYERGIWANARTTNGDLYVWIPRFTYKVAIDKKSVSIKWSNGKIDDTSDGYIVHPAFYFDEYFGGDDYNQSNGTRSDITGFWMKKEVSATSVSDISTSFDESLKLKEPDKYNLPQSGTYTHIAKASEWGAMVYLASAKGSYNSTTRYTTSNYTGVKLDAKQEYVMGIKGNPSSSAGILKSVNRKYRDKLNSSLSSYHGMALDELDNSGSISKNNYLVRGGSLGLLGYTGTNSKSDSNKGYRTTISILTDELTDAVSFFDTEATVMEGDYLILGVDFYVKDGITWHFPGDSDDLFDNLSNIDNKKSVDIKCVYEGDISCSTSDLNAKAIKLIKPDLSEVPASSINATTSYPSGKYTLVVRVGGKVLKDDEEVGVFVATDDMQAKIVVNELNLLDSSSKPFKVGSIVTNKVTLNIVNEAGTTSISKVVMTKAPDKSEYSLNEELDLSGGEIVVYLGRFATSDPMSTSLLRAEDGVTSVARTNYWVQDLYYNDVKVEQEDKYIINVSNVAQLNVIGKVSGISNTNHQLLSGPGRYTRGDSDETKVLLTSEFLDGYIFSTWQSDSSKVKASDIREYNTTFVVPSKTGSLDKDEVTLTAVYIAPESLTIQTPKKEFIVGEDFELGNDAVLNATYKNSKGNTVNRQISMATPGVEVSVTNKTTGQKCDFSNLQLGDYTVAIQYATKSLTYDIEVVNLKYKLTLNVNHIGYGEVSGVVKNTKNIDIKNLTTENENGYISENVSFGNTVNLTATPKPNYIFSRWIVEGEENLIPEASISNPAVSFVMPEKDIVVTGEFERVYTVTFKVKQGQETFGTINGTLTQTIVEGKATAPVEAVPNEGYVFVNWIDQNGEVVSTLPEFTTPYVLQDEEYTAVFAKSWIVTFYNEGEVFKVIEVENGESAYIEEVPMKEDHIFVGWDKDLSSIKQDTETHAVFVGRIQIIENETPAPNMVEAQIVGNMITDGTLQYVISSSPTNPDTPYTLDKIGELAIGDWEADTGIFRSASLEEGKDANALIKIVSRNEKEVIKFNYFVSNGDKSQFGVTINGAKVISPSDDITFGEWNEFEREVEVKDGKVEIGLSYSHGENHSVNDYAAIKDLVVSPKWTTIPNDYNLSVMAKTPVSYIHVKGTGSDNNVLYRKVSGAFNADIKYVVRYDANGGKNAPANQEKTPGVDLVLSNQRLIRDNYVFMGWNTDVDGLGESYTISGTYSEDEDVILYAQWEKAAINFTWDTTDDLGKEITLNVTEPTVVDWGDGTTSAVAISGEEDTELSHTYQYAGTYNVKILENVVTYLGCSSQQINGLDVSHATNLTWLECQENNISNLNVEQNINLEYLVCHKNLLSNLDLRNNIKLVMLDCSFNSLSTLNVENNVNLIYLEMFSNWIYSINLANNTELEFLDCGSNMLDYLDVSKNTKLKTLWCDANTISGLDVSACLGLQDLACTQETLRVLALDSRQNITTLNKHDNTKIVTITQAENGKISYNSGYKFNITPKLGYGVSTLTAGGVSQTPTTLYDFETLSNNTTLTATFVQFADVAVGSYIDYQGGDYNGKWVVLRNETGKNVEIISKENVADLTLSGADGYANAVKLLNDKSKQYINPIYAVSGRSVGATSKSIEQIDRNIYPVAFYREIVKRILPYHDDYGAADRNLIMNNAALQQTVGDVWLASRYLDPSDETNYSFNVRCVGPNGTIVNRASTQELFLPKADGTSESYTFSKGVRPIITLRQDIRITGGAGTELEPYTIGF